MKKLKSKSNLLFLLSLSAILFVAVLYPVMTHGTEVNIKFPCPSGEFSVGECPEMTTDSIPNYIVRLYQFSIGIAGILAVGMIIAGAIMYSVSGAVDKKAEGKDMIMSALWGVLLLFGSYLILKTINPRLIDLKEPEAPEVELEYVPPDICDNKAVFSVDPVIFEDKVKVEFKAPCNCRVDLFLLDLKGSAIEEFKDITVRCDQRYNYEYNLSHLPRGEYSVSFVYPTLIEHFSIDPVTVIAVAGAGAGGPVIKTLIKNLIIDKLVGFIVDTKIRSNEFGVVFGHIGAKIKKVGTGDDEIGSYGIKADPLLFKFTTKVTYWTSTEEQLSIILRRDSDDRKQIKRIVNIETKRPGTYILTLSEPTLPLGKYELELVKHTRSGTTPLSSVKIERVVANATISASPANFEEQTTIKYNLPFSMYVSLKIKRTGGSEIEIFKGTRGAGEHTQVLKNASLESGDYTITLYKADTPSYALASTNIKKLSISPGLEISPVTIPASNQKTIIKYKLPSSSKIKIEILDFSTLTPLRKILDGNVPAGSGSVTYDWSGIASGMYNVKMTHPGGTLIVVVKKG